MDGVAPLEHIVNHQTALQPRKELPCARQNMHEIHTPILSLSDSLVPNVLHDARKQGSKRIHLCADDSKDKHVDDKENERRHYPCT